MWRLSECCLGCTVRDGTKYILLFDEFKILIWAIIRRAHVQITDDGKYILLPILLYQAVAAIFAALALRGVKRRPSLIFPYIIWYIFGLIIAVPLFIVFLGLNLLWNEDQFKEMCLSHLPQQYCTTISNLVLQENFDAVIQLSIFWVLVYCMNYYFFCVVYSHYKQIQENPEPCEPDYRRLQDITPGWPATRLSTEAEPCEPDHRRHQVIAVGWPAPECAPNRNKP